MVLYTVMPLELVLEGLDEEPSPAVAEVRVRGATVVAQALGPGWARVVRVLSTDPQDYLRPEFQPGALLNWPERA